MSDTRVEHDAFGPVEVPAARYWGAQTQRALGIFAIGTERFPACLIHAFGLQKMAAARANQRCGALDARRAIGLTMIAIWRGGGVGCGVAPSTGMSRSNLKAAAPPTRPW